MNEVVALAEKLGAVGFPSLLILILYGSYKRIWVWGSQLKEKEVECEQWKTAFLRGASHTDKAIDLAAKSTGIS